jgi:hypothetical protein
VLIWHHSLLENSALALRDDSFYSRKMYRHCWPGEFVVLDGEKRAGGRFAMNGNCLVWPHCSGPLSSITRKGRRSHAQGRWKNQHWVEAD